jgi:excinuclease ABC subunit B
MRLAIDETERRRAKQLAHNAAHGITPRTVQKASQQAKPVEASAVAAAAKRAAEGSDARQLERELADLKKRMKTAAQALDFEQAALLRDQARGLEQILLAIG